MKIYKNCPSINPKPIYISTLQNTSWPNPFFFHKNKNKIKHNINKNKPTNNYNLHYWPNYSCPQLNYLSNFFLFFTKVSLTFRVVGLFTYLVRTNSKKIVGMKFVLLTLNFRFSGLPH